METTLWKINGTTDAHSAAALGLAGFNISGATQAATRLTFRAEGRAFDAEPIFAYNDPITLYKDTTPWFVGYIVATPRNGTPTSEDHDYEAVDAWGWMEQCKTPFSQDWRSGAGVISKGHVILNLDIDLAPIAIGPQIKEILDFAISLGAALQYVAAELELLTAIPPTDEPVDINIAESIRKQLRWLPDVQPRIEFSTTPPTLHFERRADATLVQYDCAAGDPAESIDIRDRPDLLATGIIINYERIDDIDGESLPVLQQDIYPAETVPGFNVPALTINIAGSQITTQTTDVVVQALGDYTAVGWWTDHLPELAGKTGLTLNSGTVSAAPYAMELLEGSVPEWTNKSTLSVVFTAKLSWTDENGSKIENSDHAVTLVTTDAETKTYTREVSYTSADPFPTGLAQALYEALSVLHYQGTFTTVEDECTGNIHPGNVLNLTGGLTAWATMRAVIQSVAFDIDQGRTTIKFGPPEHLGPQDSIALLNANRIRTTHYSADMRYTGTAAGANNVKTGGATPNSSGSGGNPRYSKLVIDDGSEVPDKKVTIDSAAIVARHVLQVKADGKDTEWAPGLPDTTGKTVGMNLRILTVQTESAAPTFEWDFDKWSDTAP